MDNITKINDIKYLIMEFYSDQEPLTEEQQKSKECFFRYCDEIRAVLKAFDALSKDDEKAKKELSKEIEKNRALEIIKSKGIDICSLKYHKDLEHYNFSLRGRFEHLTQEEYDLLREVFS